MEWLVLVLVFILGVGLGRGYNSGDSRVNKKKKELSNEYFKGLNFLLNEQHDKAIEAFIKALEVDSETVELHLALGGLFRRKGQVDRATRIHQNLIARPSLSDEQRKQAVFELAQDYLKAGLLDRAENLFIELSESSVHQQAALKNLLYIYEQEKEWLNAISVTKKLKCFGEEGISERAAHYWCELAENSIENNETDQVKKYLKNASLENKNSVRKTILEGELFLQQNNYTKAIKTWQKIVKQYPKFSTELSIKIIKVYQLADKPGALDIYLNELNYFPNEQAAFDLWLKSLVTKQGKKQAVSHVMQKANDNYKLLADYLQDLLLKDVLDYAEIKKVFINYLAKENKQTIQYSCQQCGFETKGRYWHCPGCNEWDSFY